MKRSFQWAAILGFCATSALVGCSSSDSSTDPGIDAGGSDAGGSGGSTGGSSTTGGAAGAKAGSGGTTAGAGGVAAGAGGTTGGSGGTAAGAGGAKAGSGGTTTGGTGGTTTGGSGGTTAGTGGTAAGAGGDTAGTGGTTTGGTGGTTAGSGGDTQAGQGGTAAGAGGDTAGGAGGDTQAGAGGDMAGGAGGDTAGGSGGTAAGAGGTAAGAGGAAAGSGGAAAGAGGSKAGAGGAAAGSGGAGATCQDGGPQFTGATSCSDCQNAEFAAGGCCTTESSTCAGNMACGAMIACANNCSGDATCLKNCGTANPNGVTDFNNLVGCLFGDGTAGSVGACGVACQPAAPATCTDGGTDYGAANQADCTTCQQTEFAGSGCCATESAACTANAQCGAFNKCLGTCAGDQTCQQKCASANPNGVTDFTNLYNCTFGDSTMGTVGACGTVCGAAAPPAACTDGGTNYGVPGQATCSKCQQTEFSANGCCETEAATCSANAQCNSYNTCLGTCAAGDTACQQKCGTTNSGGVADFNKLVACTYGDGTASSVGACGTVCQ